MILSCGVSLAVRKRTIEGQSFSRSSRSTESPSIFGSMMSRTMTSCAAVAGMPERGLPVAGFIDGVAGLAQTLNQGFAKGLKIFDDE